MSQNSQFDFSDLNNTEDTTYMFDPQDVSNNKGMAVLAYLSWLVLIPLLAAKDSKYARYHCNQGLVLAIIEILWGIVVGIFTAILNLLAPGIAFIANILSLVSILFTVLAIIGIVNAAQGRAKELPVIGNIRILK